MAALLAKSDIVSCRRLDGELTANSPSKCPRLGHGGDGAERRRFTQRRAITVIACEYPGEAMRKLIITAASVAALAVPAVTMATPTPGPVPGPGCFGKWRAGSVQVYNETAPQKATQGPTSSRSGRATTPPLTRRTARSTAPPSPPPARV